MSNFSRKTLAARHRCQSTTRTVSTQRVIRSPPPSRKTPGSRQRTGVQAHRELFQSPAANHSGTRGQVNDFVYSPNEGLYDDVEDLEHFDYNDDNCRPLSDMGITPPSGNIRSPVHPVPSVAFRDPILFILQEQQSLLHELLKEQQELRNLVEENKVVHFVYTNTFSV